jgi:hypothetical protein
MAVNLTIISTIDFVKSSGAITSPNPQIQILRELNGTVRPPVPTVTRQLSVSTPTAYQFDYRTTSSFQTINLSNLGNSDLVIRSIAFTSEGATPVLDSRGQLLQSGTVRIFPGTSFSFGLAYYADRGGSYSNSFIILSDDNTGGDRFTVFTQQEVIQEFRFFIEPEPLNTQLTLLGQTATKTFFPKYDDGSAAEFTAFLLNPQPGFSIRNVTANSFDVHFDSNLVNNINGVYSANVLVQVDGEIRTTVHTVEINIDTENYLHLGDWISATAYNNSVIGISYDRIEGQKYLTIGIGAGGDGSPEYVRGGAEFLNILALGPGGDRAEIPFAYWKLVYRFPIAESQAGQLLSKEYRVKSPVDIDYGEYFGDGLLQGNMFVIDHDAFGNISIRLTSLRQTTGNIDIDYTLDNLTRSLYYYSNTDVGGGRLLQKGLPLGDGSQTELLVGFNNLGQAVTSTVTIPN